MNPLQFIDTQKTTLIKTYHDLHALAEPSWQEKQTSHYLVECLKKAGLIVKTFTDHYGIVAEIPGKTQAVIALRADLDAVVQEVDGIVKPNHSCGHDAHSTMVLYTALAIANSGLQLKYTLRFIFQPAEEKGAGALKMMQENALDNVTYLFGIHLRPHFEVAFRKASPVIVHGSAGAINGTIKGIPAHASRPEYGNNAIEAAALLVLKLKQLQLGTDTPYSIKMTKLHTNNEASNVIPDTAHFTLDARAQTNMVMEDLQRLTVALMEQTMVETGTVISWSMEEFVPAAIVNKKALQLAKAAITAVLGEENVIPTCLSFGGEDFHFYTANNADLSATMIGLGCDLSPGLHHPDMTFNLDALIYGSKILTQTILLASEE
ncbi:MAG: amidohydrolase [Bacillus sp. (in: Bacteria)]|nr:amidohydrolase [Bacillus sp. (in: firmicutes)]